MIARAKNKTSPIVGLDDFCNSLPIMKICFLLGPLFFIHSFLFSQVSSVREDLLNEHIQLGKEFHRQGDFSSALMEFNLAFGYLKRNANHQLKEEISGLILETKQKLIDSKKREVVRQAGDGSNGLLPVEEEPKDFKVLHAEGKAVARKVWDNLDGLLPGQTLGVGRLIAVLPNGALEIAGNEPQNYFLRSSENSAFTLAGENTLNLHSGNYCLYTNQNTHKIRLFSADLNFEVFSYKPYVLLVEVSSPQAFLVSCILGRVRVVDQSNGVNLTPGQFIKVDPNQNWIIRQFELSSSLVQKKLLCGLSERPSFFPVFIKQAQAQAKYLRNR